MNITDDFEMPLNRYMPFGDLIISSLDNSSIVQSIAQTANVNPWAIRCGISEETERVLLSKGAKGLAILLATTSNERLIEDTLGLADNCRSLAAAMAFLPYLAYNSRISEKHLDALVYAAIDHRNVDIVAALLRGRKDFGTLLNKYGNLGALVPFWDYGLVSDDVARFLVLASFEEFELCRKYFLDNLSYDQWSKIVNAVMKLVPKFPVSVDKYRSLTTYSSLECMPRMYKIHSSIGCSELYLNFSNKVLVYGDSEFHGYLSGLEPYEKRNLLKVVESNPYSTYSESFSVLVLASMGQHGGTTGRDPDDFVPETRGEIPDLWSESTRLWVAKHCARSLGNYEEYTVFAKLLPEWGGSLYDLLRVSKTL